MNLGREESESTTRLGRAETRGLLPTAAVMTERFVLNGGNEHQVYKLGGKVKTDILMQF